jgi:hypothetical protein
VGRDKAQNGARIVLREQTSQRRKGAEGDVGSRNVTGILVIDSRPLFLPRPLIPLFLPSEDLAAHEFAGIGGPLVLTLFVRLKLKLARRLVNEPQSVLPCRR